MLYDLADIMALRFAGHVRNIPIELPQSFHGNIFSEETLLALCRQKVLTENRNHRSYSLTPAGIALLEHLGYTYQLDSRQPAQAKLERRLMSAAVSALFCRAGFNVFLDKLEGLTSELTYLSSAVLRRDPSSAASRVFAGVRFTGIAHAHKRALLIHYIDDGFMYFTSEMRMFHGAVSALSCPFGVVYTGKSYEQITQLLTASKAFSKSKSRAGDALTYRIAAERTMCPLYLVEATETGARHLMLLQQKGYRAKIANYALQEQYLPPPQDAPMLDAMMGGTPFLVCVDMDIQRIRASCRYARANGYTELAAVALPAQIGALARWMEDMFPCELYAIEESALLSIYPELTLQETEREPVLQRGGGCYVPVV